MVPARTFETRRLTRDPITGRAAFSWRGRQQDDSDLWLSAAAKIAEVVKTTGAFCPQLQRGELDFVAGCMSLDRRVVMYLRDSGKRAPRFYHRTERVECDAGAAVEFGEGSRVLRMWPQCCVDRYRVDFMIEHGGRCIAVECDGVEHQNKSARRWDDRRDRFLESIPIQVVRFTNHELAIDPVVCWRRVVELTESK